MPSPSKSKGNAFERKVVNLAKEKGLEAIRAWGSNGVSIGQHEEVDVLIDKIWKVQCKCRAKIAQWIKPNENVDIQVVKENYGDIFVIIPYERFLELIKVKGSK
jgi:Holliday junction resolvase